MQGLTVWRRQEISKFKRDMDRLFNRLWDDFGTLSVPVAIKKVPSIDISETEDKLIINVGMPGMNPEDIELSILEDVLSIKGEVKGEFIEEGGKYHRMERRHGFLSRTIQLPCRVVIDKINATFKNGILNIILPKYKPETAREIKIEIK